MRRIMTSFAYAFILCFWLGTAAAFIKWLAEGRHDLMINLFMFALNVFCWSFSLLLAVRLAAAVYTRSVYVSFRKAIAKDGVTLGLLGDIKRWSERPRDAAERADRELLLAEVLSDGCLYRQAFSTLSRIDLSVLSEEAKEEYYNVYVYTNLMMGDVEAAETIYNAAGRYFDRARLRRRPMPVLHTLGVLSYAKGDLIQAENYLKQALSCSSSKQARCDCNIYLSLCYLKAGRPDLAVDLAAEAAGQAQTVRQKHELIELKRRILKICT